MAKIRLVLTQEAKRNVFSEISSDNYAGLMLSVLVPLDLLYTYTFRYDKLLEHDLTFDSLTGKNPDSQGTLVDFTSNNHANAALITVAFLSIAALSLYQKYKDFQQDREEALKERNSSLLIFNKMKRTQFPQIEVSSFNKELAILLQNSPLKTQYKSILLEDSGLAFEVETFEAAPPIVKKKSLGTITSFILKKFISPLWEMLGLASFTYWILWIGVGLVTGASIPTELVYAMSGVIGILYPVFKIRNWIKNKNEKPVLIKETAKDVADLTYQFFFNLRKLRLEAELNQFCEKNKFEDTDAQLINEPRKLQRYANEKERESILALTKSKKKRLLVTGITSLFGTYIAVQYASWILTDFIYAVSSVSNLASFGLVQIIAGIACMVIAGATGIYKAYQAYYGDKGIKHYEDKIKALDVSKEYELQKLEKDLQNQFESLKSQIRQLRIKADGYSHKLSVDINDEFLFGKAEVVKSITSVDKFKSLAIKAFHFINGACSGIFIGRVFLIKGSAIFLPFAAAALSNPVTIGILVGIGVLYGAVKLYQYYQDKKIREAKKAWEKRENNVVKLQDKIELAQIFVRTHEARLSTTNTLALNLVPTQNSFKQTLYQVEKVEKSLMEGKAGFYKKDNKDEINRLLCRA